MQQFCRRRRSRGVVSLPLELRLPYYVVHIVELSRRVGFPVSAVMAGKRSLEFCVTLTFVGTKTHMVMKKQPLPNLALQLAHVKMMSSEGRGRWQPFHKKQLVWKRILSPERNTFQDGVSSESWKLTL